MNRRTTSITAGLTLLITIILTTTPSLCDTQLTTDSADDWSPSITQTSDGKIWVTWHSFRTGNPDVFYKTYNGTSWSTPTQLTSYTNVDGLPSITQARDGKLWVAWTSSRTGNYDIFYKTSSDNGTSWSTPTQLTTDPGDDRYSSIIQAHDGKLWVAWTSSRTGNYDIFYKTSSDNGTSWSIETQLTTDLGDDKAPSIVQALNGTTWVTWTSNRTGNYDIFYKTSSDNGTSWSTPTQLTTDPGDDRDPSVMQTHEGPIWIAWQADRDIQDDIYYKIYDGSSWSPENKLTWYMDNDIMPSIFQAADKTIWLAWASDKIDNFDIYYKFVTVDVAVRNVTTSSTTVSQGNTVDIYVEVQNEGTAGATFNVTAYYNGTAIGTQKRTLVPSVIPHYLVFKWNTTGITPGRYVISANITSASGEVDTADNTFVDGTVTVVIHDVAVTSVAPSETVAQRGYPLQIRVELKNEGTCDETFSVTAYYNLTKIGAKTITLASNATATVVFPWETTSVPYGTYIISAEAEPLSDEADLSDNSLTDGTVLVTIPGDVNGDRIVDVLDVGVISAHWYPGPPVGSLGYDLDADVNNDGKVNIFDLAIASTNWLKSW